MEDKYTEKQTIDISVLKGDKLFNQNTPFIINLFAPESKDLEEKTVSADLICIIDVSGSMNGEKIYQVKESLKILIDMMDPKDRIALVLFERKATLFYALNYLKEENKIEIKNLIDKIKTGGGTNISSGLEIAVELLKKEKLNNQNEEGRSYSVILLSDGRDNYFNDIQLGENLKNLTKGQGLSFTLNTFGYGYDHDPKIMNKLANLRDGSFFLVEDYNKVGEYFVSVLGGVISMISKNSELNLKLMDQNCKIIKIFGENNLYSYELKDFFFKNRMLQFIRGKEYTFVLEIFIDESNVKPGDILLDIDFIYDDIMTKKTIKLSTQYKYELNDLQFTKANEEYIRCQTYYIMEKAVKLREEKRYDEGKKILKEMKEWLQKNYTGENKTFLKDITKSEEMFSNNPLAMKSVTKTISAISQNISKRIGDNMQYSNMRQSMLQDQFRMNLNKSQKMTSNNYS